MWEHLLSASKLRLPQHSTDNLPHVHATESVKCKQLVHWKAFRRWVPIDAATVVPSVGSMHSVLRKAIPKPSSPASRNAPNALHERFLFTHASAHLLGALRMDALHAILARWSPEVRSTSKL